MEKLALISYLRDKTNQLNILEKDIKMIQYEITLVIIELEEEFKQEIKNKNK